MAGGRLRQHHGGRVQLGDHALEFRAHRAEALRPLRRVLGGAARDQVADRFAARPRSRSGSRFSGSFRML